MGYLYIVLVACAVTLSSVAGNQAYGEEISEQGQKYLELAQKHKPDSSTEPVVRKYMNASPDQRVTMKSQTKGGGSPLDYAAYAVCFYSQLAGGADAESAGVDCSDQYLN